jgi:putative hemin transport protein
MINTETKTIQERWEEFKIQNPKIRIRDAAREIGVSEAELVAVGEKNIQLTDTFEALLKEIPALGEVMALTRNDSCVHERHGIYKDISFDNHVGLVLGEDIDLRLFMTFWKFGFAVNENDRLSLQFFAGDGEAVHKIYMTEKSNLEAYHAVVEKYKASNSDEILAVSKYSEKESENSDESIDVKGFREAWLTMTDTHQFFGMLKKYKVTRTQGLRLAPEGYAWQISTDKLKHIFEQVSHTKLPVMIFVASRGCIQIHTGEVKNLMQTGSWFNVIDPTFNLHLKEDNIHQIWVTRKPTEDGIVTGIELFDAKGNNIALLFGKRKPGIPEMKEWTELAGS